MVIDLLILFTFFAFVMLAIALFYKDEYDGGYWLVFMAGMMLAMLGVYAMINGFGRTNDWLTRSIAGVIIGIGLTAVTTTGINVIRKVAAGKKAEAEDF